MPLRFASYGKVTKSWCNVKKKLRMLEQTRAERRRSLSEGVLSGAEGRAASIRRMEPRRRNAHPCCVAPSASEALFRRSFRCRGLRGKAPELLTPHTPWTTPLKATNRLLVGPFDSQRAAQDFVNKLAPKGITAFAWTSAQGQAITKLAIR